MRKFLGFQLCNSQGVNIQGDDEDPTGIASFEIMSPEVALEVMSKGWGKTGKYLLMPIFEGDIEEPSILTL